MNRYNIDQLKEINCLYSRVMKEIGYRVFEFDENTHIIIREDRELYIDDIIRVTKIYENCLYELCHVRINDEETLGIEIYRKIIDRCNGGDKK